MNSQVRVVFALVALMVFMSVSSVSSQDAGKEATNEIEVLKQVDLSWSKTAVEKQNDKFFGYFLDDVSVLAPNAPVVEGKEGAVALFGNLFGMSGFYLKWEPTYAYVSSSNDLGYTYGTYEMKFDDPDGNQIVDNGKYMTVWKKDNDGSWKVAADMFNTNTQMPTSKN